MEIWKRIEKLYAYVSLIKVLFQKELPNKFYNINQQNTETLEDLDDVGKMTLKLMMMIKV
jgi:hypothetical protein